MKVNTDETEITWYLQMLSPEELRPKDLLPESKIVKLGIPLPAINRFFYKEVGKLWEWTDRLNWTEEEWIRWVENENVQTWMLHLRGTPAGYFELDNQDGNLEVAYFGLLPQFLGKGLGGGFLTAAVEKAWEMGAARVWVHTCSLDHPHALKNYQARGFQIYSESRDK